MILPNENDTWNAVFRNTEKNVEIYVLTFFHRAVNVY